MNRTRAVSCFGLIGLALCVAACTPKHVSYTPPPDRASGLPDDVARLLEMSDQVAASMPKTPAEADRGLAAAEKALELGGDSPFEALWRLSRDSHTMADLITVNGQKESYANKGREFGEQAAEREPARVEGWYYAAVNTARGAEATSQTGPLGRVVELAEKAIAVDPAFDDAAPLRLLGKVLMVAPEWPTSVGDRERAVEVLKRAVSTAATPLNRLFLGEALYHAEDHAGAAAQLKRALKDGEGAGLDKRWVEEAKDYLRRLGER